MEPRIEKFTKFQGEKSEMIQYLIKSGNDPKKVMDIYSTWAQDYDHDFTTLSQWNCPFQCSHIVQSLYTQPCDITILDLAAGTGMMGTQLHSMGFHKIDALDGSSAMLEKAAQKQVYRKLMCQMVGEEQLTIDDDSYDVVATTGSFLPGHLDHRCFPEVLRILKPGGYFVLVMAENYLSDSVEFRGILESNMDAHVTQGLWKMIQKETIPNYHDDITGVSFVFQKC